ncbi:MAG: trigger factor [Oscillospiraceae bacterium]|nr:trigger factor [Oscillospiraceae bacterium]
MSLISETKTDVNMREVTFSISAEDLERACERVYNRQKKDIAVKGFRKGKVPRKIVERLYGEEVFFEDAVNSLIPGELDTIISDLGLTIIDRPSVELVSCTKAEGAVCKAVLFTKPEVTVSEYKGIHAPMIVHEVTDEDVDRQIEMLRQRQARVVDVEGRAAEMGDETTINFEGFIDDEAFEGGKGEAYPLRLGSGQFIPGFEEGVVGHNIGEQFDVNVTFPENYGDERFAGKAAVFKVELLSLTMQELPEVDDEFAKDVSEFDTLAEMREDIKKHLTEQAEQQAKTAFENAVCDVLAANTEGIIPQVMYDRRIDQHIHEFEHQLHHQYGDLSLNDYLQLTGMTMEQLRDEYEERAKKEVMLRLALEKVAESEGITVSDEELEEALVDFAAQMEAPVELVKARIPVEEYRTDLIVTKALEFVKSNAVVDNDAAPASDENAEAEAEAAASEAADEAKADAE